MENLIALWLERAQYDWETAGAMMSAGRYLYVAFMCQQAVEKMLKGVIQGKTKETPPYTHNLSALAKASDVKFLEEQLDFLSLLTGYYMNTRYPDYKQRLAKEIDRNKAEEILKKSEDIYQCLKRELPT